MRFDDHLDVMRLLGTTTLCFGVNDEIENGMIVLMAPVVHNVNWMITSDNKCCYDNMKNIWSCSDFVEKLNI